MFNWFFLCFVSFLFPKEVLFSLGESTVYDYDFFHSIPKSSWVEADSIKKNNIFNDFLERELVFYHSLFSGFNHHYKNFTKLKRREEQVLVNTYYENVVAKPLFDEKYLNQSKKNISNRVFVHHIMIGYKGCSLGGDFTKTKEEALSFGLTLHKTINDTLSLSDIENSIPIFSSFAEELSEDPSVFENKGKIGWISWGQVMPSFQEKAFSLDVLSVSEPVLTDFGYHLILVEKKGFSDYHYYNKKYSDGLLVKFALQHVNVDSLRNQASLFDSLYIKNNELILNDSFLDEIVLFFNKKTKQEKLRGGKNVYVDWLGVFEKQDVFFVFQNKGFGLSWFKNKIKNSPSTRVRPLREREDFILLLKSFLLEEGVLRLAYEKELNKTFWFKTELEKHSKNILYKSFEDYSLNLVPLPDSSLVEKYYNNGVFKGDHIKPRQVLFSEIRVNSFSLADSLLNDFLIFKDFEKLADLFGGKIKKPISEGGGGFLGEAAFSLDLGGVSKVVSNIDKSFSIIRVERFIEAEPFVLDRVYSQIENKIKKNLKDSVKKNLSKNLLNLYKLKKFKGVLSF